MKTGLLGAISAVTLASGVLAQAAEIRVFCTGAARSAYEELAPQFEKATGHKLVTHFGLPSELVQKLDAGDPVDAIILSYDIERLIKQGKVTASSRVVLGRTGVGIAIPQGFAKPDYNSADALKRSLLTAKFIATSGEGSSGQYVLSLLDRLGIGADVKPKIKSGASGQAAKLLAAKEVDFAVIGLPPVAGVPGVEWLGYLPDDLNSWLPFTGGVSVKATEPEAANALLKFLITSAAATVFKSKGLEPVP
jgi:molybdate transport system substrate-binding protein